jgi:hypothetical protein
MPRTKTKGELWKRLDYAYVLRDDATPVTDTLNGAIVAGAATFDLQTGEGADFSTDDRGRIGAEDEIEEFVVESVATDEITPKSEVAFDHADGKPVELREQIDLGHLTDDGVRFQTPGDHNPINVVTRTLAWGYIVGHTEQIAEFSLANWNLENIATSFGIDEGDISGAGTAADPYRLVIDPEGYNADINMSFVFEGSRHDGSTLRGELWAAEPDITAMNAQLARGVVAPLGMRVRATSATAMFLWS